MRSDLDARGRRRLPRSRRRSPNGRPNGCSSSATRTPHRNPLAALGDADAPAGVGLLIGPEGGFDDAERAAILALPRVLRLSLGPRVLRADTAAVAALALIQATLGDWPRHSR